MEGDYVYIGDTGTGTPDTGLDAVRDELAAAHHLV